MDIETQKKFEEDVEKTVNRMKKGHKLILYKYLHNDGYRMADIEQELRKIKQYEQMDTEPQPSSQSTAPDWYYPGFI